MTTKSRRLDSAHRRVLCVDAGNNRIKCAIVRGNSVAVLDHVATDAVRRGLPRAVADAARTADGVIVSSVVPSIRDALARQLARAAGHEPLFVDHRSRFPFRLQVDLPRRVGVDRLCAAVGAMYGRRTPAIVVDIGSAITVDRVTVRAYHGGVIIAGPALCLLALGEHAEQLPRIDYSRIREHFPRRSSRTEPSMILGTNLGAVGAIKEAVRRQRAASTRRYRVVVTGGGAPALLRALPRSWTHDASLVHRGLAALWGLNSPGLRDSY